MKLLVGLGNPGAAYARHRHNIGFMALDALAATHGFTPWKNRFSGQFSEGSLPHPNGGAPLRCWLLKPQTFMNLSGQSVGEAARFFRIPTPAVLALHDDLDLAPGVVRVKQGGSAGGHNGLRSLDAHIGVEYWRLRLGIGHPGHRDQVTPYVLGDFAKTDTLWLADLLQDLALTLNWLLADDPARFTTALALRRTNA